MFQPWNRLNVNGTAQVSGGPAVLHSIVVNGVTTAGDVTIWDGDIAVFPFPFPIFWGNVIGVLHLNPLISVSVQPIPLLYDAECHLGIYLDFDGTLVSDLTVTYH